MRHFSSSRCSSAPAEFQVETRLVATRSADESERGLGAVRFGDAESIRLQAERYGAAQSGIVIHGECEHAVAVQPPCGTFAKHGSDSCRRRAACAAGGRQGSSLTSSIRRTTVVQLARRVANHRLHAAMSRDRLHVAETRS
jgi:hypothetical protein